MKPAADIRQKIQDKWPGAEVVGRGRGYLLHRNSADPSQYALDTQIGAIHFGPGHDQEIDTAWQPDSGAWQYKMVLADFNVFARDVLNAGTLVEYRNPATGNGITFQPLALNWSNQDNSRQQLALPQAVTATVDPDDDGKLIWTDGYGAGITFEYQIQTERLRKYVILDSLGVIPQPEPWMTGTLDLEIEFIIGLQSNITPYVDGQPWDKTNQVATGNRIDFRDEGSQVNWYLDFPMAIDSNGVILPGTYQLRKQGASFYITVRIPKVLVDSAAFPLRIDPTITPTTQQSADDAFSDNGGNWSLTGNLFHGVATNWDPPSRSCGYRWQVTGPTKTDSITLAYVECNAPSGGSNYVPIRFSGDDVDNAGVFVNTQTPETSFTRTTANTSWYVNGSYIGGIYNRPGDPANQQVTEVVGEIIARAGWASGNYLRLMAEGFGGTANYQSIQFDSYDQNSTNSPRLHIEYTVTGTIIEESITLGRTERCAEPAGGATEEAISANRVMTSSQVTQLTAVSQTTTAIFDGVTSDENVTVGNPITMAKSNFASVVSGITFEDGMSLAAALGLTLGSDKVLLSGITLNRVAGDSESSGVNVTDLVTIDRFLAADASDQVSVFDAALLNRILEILITDGTGGVQESISLGLIRTDLPASNVIAGESAVIPISRGSQLATNLIGESLVVVAIFEGVTAEPQPEGIQEAIGLGLVRTFVGGDGVTLLDAITLTEINQSAMGDQLFATGSVVVDAVRGESEASELAAGNSVSLGLIGAVSAVNSANMSEQAIIDLVLDATFGVGHKLVPTRFYVLGPRDVTEITSGRRVFILPPRRSL